MLNVLYDLTYAARGNSGIPKDTRSVAKILNRIPNTRTGYVISPKSFISRYAFTPRSRPVSTSKLLSNILQNKSSLFFSNLPSKYVRSSLQSISLLPFLSVTKLNPTQIKILIKQLQINNSDLKPIPYFWVLNISYLARFIRPKFLGLFRLNTRNTDVFIQQQIDPIRVNRNTKHIVRLHDILPITHPFFFTTKAQLAFRQGLVKMLGNKRIIWVMDTVASKNEFIEVFGDQLKVEVIPCEVGSGWDSDKVLKDITKKSFGEKSIFLVVGTIEPRKNIELIINTFLSLQNKDFLNSKNWQLIIAGSAGWLNGELLSQLRLSKFGPDINFIEGASDTFIGELYSRADFIISASEAEGFGLTPLEGMFFGCIPIVSNIPQHREIMGTNALYFDVYEKSLTIAIKKAMEIPSKERLALRLKGHKFVTANYGEEAITQKWASLLKKLKP